MMRKIQIIRAGCSSLMPGAARISARGDVTRNQVTRLIFFVTLEILPRSPV